jgi:hypothetical protein
MDLKCNLSLIVIEIINGRRDRPWRDALSKVRLNAG